MRVAATDGDFFASEIGNLLSRLNDGRFGNNDGCAEFLGLDSSLLATLTVSPMAVRVLAAPYPMTPTMLGPE